MIHYWYSTQNTEGLLTGGMGCDTSRGINKELPYRKVIVKSKSLENRQLVSQYFAHWQAPRKSLHCTAQQKKELTIVKVQKVFFLTSLFNDIFKQKGQQGSIYCYIVRELLRSIWYLKIYYAQNTLSIELNVCLNKVSVITHDLINHKNAKMLCITSRYRGDPTRGVCIEEKHS